MSACVCSVDKGRARIAFLPDPNAELGNSHLCTFTQWPGQGIRMSLTMRLEAGGAAGRRLPRCGCASALPASPHCSVSKLQCCQGDSAEMLSVTCFLLCLQGNERRLTGKHETSSMHDFSWGVANRGCSVRVGRMVPVDKCGYYEDRRPASNLDPYVVCKLLVETTLLM